MVPIGTVTGGSIYMAPPGTPPPSTEPGRITIPAVLERVSYRPGWKIEYLDDGMGFARLVVRAPVANTYDPSQQVEILHSFPVPYYIIEQGDEQLILKWLARTLQQVEIHESREWFRVNGAIYDNPHESPRGY